MDSNGSLLSVCGKYTRMREPVTVYGDYLHGARFERIVWQFFFLRLAASTTATLTPIRVMLSDHYSLRSHYYNRPREIQSYGHLNLRRWIGVAW